MNLVLITGAGASRSLGKDGVELPLMSDWAGELCRALDQREAGLAQAAGLTPDMDGPDFERCLGLLLRWARMRALEQRFHPLGGPAPGHIQNYVTESFDRATTRLSRITEQLNGTLYDLFGNRRIDAPLATKTFKSLLSPFEPFGALAVATTNYDLAGENGLRQLGYRVADGFTTDLIGEAPSLHVDGLVDWDSVHRDRTPFLHLHGAVGWYQQDGKVLRHFADQPFNATLGSPVVLYPDPDKDPTSDESVAAIWREFHRALDGATHVFVVGHSLHDPALVAALQSKRDRVAVLAYTDEDGECAEFEYLASQLPDAAIVRGRLDAELVLQNSAQPFESWIAKHQ